VVHTDGWEGYTGLEPRGYQHEVTVLRSSPQSASQLLPRVQRGGRAAQALAARDPSGRSQREASGLLLGRIHVPLQSSSIALAGEAVLSPAATGRGCGTGTLQSSGGRVSGQNLKSQPIDLLESTEYPDCKILESLFCCLRAWSTGPRCPGARTRLPLDIRVCLWVGDTRGHRRTSVVRYDSLMHHSRTREVNKTRVSQVPSMDDPFVSLTRRGRRCR